MVNILNFIYYLISKNLPLEKLLRKVINIVLDFYENIFYPYPNRCLEIKKWPPKKILLFAYGGTGDIAYYSSFTQYLKKKFNKCKIYYVINDNKRLKFTASLDKNIDKIISVKHPRFFRFNFYHKIKKNLKYDVALIMNPYPDLRYLTPHLLHIQWPFFLFRENLIDKPPIPKLIPNFKIKKQDYIFLNLEILTFNFSENFFNQTEIIELIKFLLDTFPKEKFIANKYVNFDYKKIQNYSNLKIFSGDYKNLIKLASQAKLAILFRSGLADVLAALNKKLPMFVIYPDALYPGKNGSPFIKIFGLKNIYKLNKLEEFVYENRKFFLLKKKLSIFIKNNL